MTVAPDDSVLFGGPEKARGHKDKEKVQELQRGYLRLPACDRLIPLNCVELRGIIFSILGKRGNWTGGLDYVDVDDDDDNDNGNDDGDDDDDNDDNMQRTPGSHKAVGARDMQRHASVQGVSQRPCSHERKKQLGDVKNIHDMYIVLILTQNLLLLIMANARFASTSNFTRWHTHRERTLGTWCIYRWWLLTFLGNFAPSIKRTSYFSHPWAIRGKETRVNEVRHAPRNIASLRFW